LCVARGTPSVRVAEIALFPSLFKDQTGRHSLKTVAQWTITQERNRSRAVLGKASRFWQVGLQREDGHRVEELFAKTEGKPPPPNTRRLPPASTASESSARLWRQCCG